MRIIDSLENYLLIEVAADIGKQSLVADEDLLEQGIIDSLGLMKLIVFLENSYGIVVMDEEVLPENFQNLTSIVKFVEQKIQNK